jgi:hypothetical protein
MATLLTKPVVREVASTVFRAPALIVTLAAHGIEFRAKGTRTRYTLPYEVGYLRAATLAADAARAARRTPRAVRSSRAAARGLLAMEARR